MTNRTVTLQIPEVIYELAEQIAGISDMSTEDVLLDRLTSSLTDFSLDLSDQDLETLSDDQLWALVMSPFGIAQRLRLRELNLIGKQGELTDEEDAEMERLLDEVDDYVLRRSSALLILKQRGHDIETQLGWKKR